ncbi:MAG: SAM-dependent methyltransferase [Crenarchaeota archaeon]|nr:SAM-dependent methyltransferase [Thermoproteota archaeon]
MLEMLGVGPRDVLVDLGCGDGRVVVKAAKRGARSVCVEIDRVLCNVTEIWARVEGVEDRVEVICKSFFDVDLGSVNPTIVYAYLYPSVLEQLSPKLEDELSDGTIIVTLDFAIRGWSPVYARVLVDENKFDRVLWMYVTGLSNPKARRVGIAKNLGLFVSRLRSRSLRGVSNA